MHRKCLAACAGVALLSRIHFSMTSLRLSRTSMVVGFPSAPSHHVQSGRFTGFPRFRSDLAGQVVREEGQHVSVAARLAVAQGSD